MGHRLSKIYTRTGDDGTTGLGDGSRIDKDHARMEAIGTVDELNSQIGVLITELESGDNSIGLLSRIQHDLFDLGGELHLPHGGELLRVGLAQLLGAALCIGSQSPLGFERRD